MLQLVKMKMMYLVIYHPFLWVKKCWRGGLMTAGITEVGVTNTYPLNINILCYIFIDILYIF